MKSEYHGLGSLGGSAGLSNAIPQPLGIPAPGVGGAASRDDHVHQMPALGDLTNVSVAAPNNLDVLTYDLGTATWIAAPGGGGGGAVDPYLVINSGPPNGFFGFPGDVLLAPEAGVVQPAVTRYIAPSTSSLISQFVVGTNAPDVNVALVLNPKGTGGIQAQVADGTILGGNARGDNAVDLQTATRSNANQVASGASSVIAGGLRNTASQQYATVGGGSGNTASGNWATVGGGSSNVASGSVDTVVGGITNTASGAQSTVGGGSTNIASGTSSTAAGVGNTASGADSVAGGRSGVANQSGMFSHASGGFSTAGDAQYSRMILRRQTTDATPTVLSANGGAPVATTIFLLANNSCFTFSIQVSARQNTTGDTAWWKFEGCIKRGASAATTTLVGSVFQTTDADAGAAAWAFAVTADTTNGALELTATGEALKTIRWVATVHTTKVAG